MSEPGQSALRRLRTNPGAACRCPDLTPTRPAGRSSIRVGHHAAHAPFPRHRLPPGQGHRPPARGERRARTRSSWPCGSPTCCGRSSARAPCPRRSSRCTPSLGDATRRAEARAFVGRALGTFAAPPRRADRRRNRLLAVARRPARPQFPGEPGQFELTVVLNRWILPYVFLVSLAAFCQAILERAAPVRGRRGRARSS